MITYEDINKNIVFGYLQILLFLFFFPIFDKCFCICKANLNNKTTIFINTKLNWKITFVRKLFYIKTDKRFNISILYVDI